MISNKKRLAQGLAVAVMLSTVGAVSAENSKVEEFSFDKIVVTAQRMETKDLETPASITVITGQELKDSGALTVFDALEHTVGINSYSYGTGGQEYGAMMSRVMVRGLDKGTLVLVNGAPINLMNYNTMAVIPVEAVDRIEIVKGSNAVLYGAEAMGGVINIITKKAAGDNTGSVSTTYGNYYKDNAVTVNGENFTVFYKKEFRSEVDELSRVFTTSFNKLSLGKGNKESLFFNLNLTDDLSLNYSYSNNESNFKSWKYNTTDKAYTTLYKNNIYYDKRNNINFVYDDKDANVKSVLAYNSLKLKGGGDATTDYDLYGINFDNQKTWQLRDGKDFLVTGFTLQREHLEKDSTNNFDRDSYALYGSYSRQMNDKLTATLGLREHFVKANEYDASQNITLPQLQTLYKVDDKTSWYTNVGKSFEMPATSSPFYSSKVSTAIKLKPQDGWTYETGIKHINGNESFKVALFAMEINNKFKWVKENTVIPGGDSNTSIQINKDKFRNKGIELEYSRKLNTNWQYDLGASFSDPESKDGDSNWEQDEAKLQLTAGVSYVEKKLMTNLDFFYLGKREMAYYNLSGSTASQDHHVGDRFDLNATIQYRATDHDSFTLSGYNLLDRDNPINYTEYWSTPINYRLTYTRTF